MKLRGRDIIIGFDNFYYFCSPNKWDAFAKATVNGQLSEWLGIGLQNRLRRFESATDLNQSPGHEVPGDFLFSDEACLQS
jgi:hypothetical protein